MACGIFDRVIVGSVEVEAIEGSAGKPKARPVHGAVPGAREYRGILARRAGNLDRTKQVSVFHGVDLALEGGCRRGRRRSFEEGTASVPVDVLGVHEHDQPERRSSLHPTPDANEKPGQSLAGGPGRLLRVSLSHTGESRARSPPRLAVPTDSGQPGCAMTPKQRRRGIHVRLPALHGRPGRRRRLPQRQRPRSARTRASAQARQTRRPPAVSAARAAFHSLRTPRSPRSSGSAPP